MLGRWHGYLSGARCRLAHAQLMPLPLTVSCFSEIQIGFTFLVPAHPGSPGKRAVKWVCVCHIFGADEGRHFKFGEKIERKKYYYVHVKIPQYGVRSGSLKILGDKC